MTMPVTLHDAHRADGAVLANDGIPQHYADPRADMLAAMQSAVIMDRSHEGRLQLTGRDRLALPDRISTNAIEKLAPGSAAPTLFLTPNARIIDRVTIGALDESALMLTEPGRATAVETYLKRNTFYNDDMGVVDISAASRQFVLFGSNVAAIMAEFGIGTAPLTLIETAIDGVRCIILHDKPFAGDPGQDMWRVIVPSAAPDYSEAARVWRALSAAGAAHALRPTGSQTYFALRVRAGRPGVNAELSGEYIPLEIGLWDEISFTKGCYTGQEIIARMESRRKLARTIIQVAILDGAIPVTPTALSLDGREVGRLTSAVEEPFGARGGIAVVRLAAAQVDTLLTFDGGRARIISRAGVQPDTIEE